ncbi:MAG: hypothetical protein IJV14_10740 [Lachnospiraceae bacterium]|nr:hypothetical protein [Lachnospiraceae bacterium]
MFSKNLGAVAPFISDVADGMFPTINGYDYRGDESFVATLRALLSKRLPEGGGIRLNLRRAEFSSENLDSMNKTDIIREALGSEISDTLTVVDCHMSDEAMDKLIASLDDENEGFVKTRGGQDFRQIADVVAQYTKCRIYSVPEKRYSVIMVHNLDIRKWHFIQSFIFKCLPWFFEDSPLNDLEKKLILSFREKNAPAYEAAIAAIAETFDFRNAAIKKVLKDFERNARRGQIETTREELSEIDNNVQRLQNKFREFMDQRDRIMIRLAGLENIIATTSDDSELVEYFQANKTLTPIKAEGMSISFHVKTFLEYFDAEMYRTSAARGSIFDNIPNLATNSPFASREDKKLLLDAIFSDEPLLRVKLCAYYKIDVRGDVCSERGHAFPSEFDHYMPNPHLQRHNCLGSHEGKIRDLLRHGDTIMAIEQCISSAKSINMSEWGPTMSYFVSDLMSTNKKVIRLEDGTDMSPVEALNWLKERKKSEVKS